MTAFRLEESDELPEQHSLTVNTTGGGSVMLNPAGGLYYHGSRVTLTPVANAGWSFAGWSGPNAGDLINQGDGSWQILMDADKEVTAQFTDTVATLTFQQGVNGYNGTVDTHIMQANPSTSYGDSEVLEWDTQSVYYQNNTEAVALL